MQPPVQHREIVPLKVGRKREMEGLRSRCFKEREVPIRSVIWNSARIAGRLVMVCSIPCLLAWACIFVTTYVVLLKFEASSLFNAGTGATRAREVVIADTEISLEFSNVWGTVIVFLMFYVPIYTFFPACFAAYCKMSWKVHGGLVLVVIISIVIFLRLPPMKTFRVILPFTLWIPAFYYVLPRDSKVGKHIWMQLFCILLGVVLMQLIYLMPGNSNRWFHAAVLIFIIPIVKEVTGYFTRTSVHALALSESVIGTTSLVSRGKVWPLLVWPYIAYGTMVRLYYTNLESYWLHTVLIYQSLVEIALRLSVEKRDRKIRRMKTWCRKKLRPSVMKEESRRSVPLEIVSVDLQANPNLVFYSMVVTAETIGEYAGILCSGGIVLLFSGRKMYIPLDIYNSWEMPFSTTFPENIFTTMLSLIFFPIIYEFVTDVICFSFEHRRGLCLDALWNTASKPYLFFALYHATYFALGIIFPLIMYKDNLDACGGVDMCVCKDGNGLAAEGLRQRYCNYLNTTN